MGPSCAAHDPDAVWLYCPSFGAAVLFSILFGLTFIAHFVQAIVYRKGFAWVVIMGAAWETMGMTFRTFSTKHQDLNSWFIVQSLLILLAPLWINAFVYMVLGRMVNFYLEDKRVLGIPARKLTLYFVLLDIW